MYKISKRQRVSLREIEKLSKERKNDQIWGVGAIVVMALLIFIYNLLVYQLGIVAEDNMVVRAMLYITAMVAAGLSGIKFMRASQKQKKIDGLRQSAAISRDTLDAWNRGEIEK